MSREQEKEWVTRASVAVQQCIWALVEEALNSPAASQRIDEVLKRYGVTSLHVKQSLHFVVEVQAFEKLAGQQACGWVGIHMPPPKITAKE